MIRLTGFIRKFLIRFFDILLSLAGLILLLPFLILISLVILADFSGPVIFRQTRVGKNNIDFTLLKFRTMHIGSDKKGLITIGRQDQRVTSIGKFLRKFKLDELPQLFNVLSGDMSIVGPRPEVRHYTKLYSPAAQMIILSVKPGITDNASIEFSNENELLSKANDPERYYIEEIMPIKIRLNMIYIENLTFGNYLRILFKTVGKVLSGRG